MYLNDWIVQTEHLGKSYRGTGALQDCNLHVESGTIFGLLGPNGAGKSTLLRILLGFIRPTSGSARVCGYDCVLQSLEVRKQVSYLPGEARLFRTMRGDQILRLFSGLQSRGSLPASRKVAERLELDLTRRVMFMSTGMRQKLALSVVLGSFAPLVILDEPTANLDPTVRGEVLSLVREIRAQRRSVIMSSHIFSDIEDTCDDVAILQAGKIVAKEHLKQVKQLHVVRGKTVSPIDSQKLSSPDFVRFAELSGDDVELHLAGEPTQWLSWLSEFQLAGMRIESAGVRAVYERFHRPMPQTNATDVRLPARESQAGRAEVSLP